MLTITFLHKPDDISSIATHSLCFYFNNVNPTVVSVLLEAMPKHFASTLINRSAKRLCTITTLNNIEYTTDE